MLTWICSLLLYVYTDVSERSLVIYLFIHFYYCPSMQLLGKPEVMVQTEDQQGGVRH